MLQSDWYTTRHLLLIDIEKWRVTGKGRVFRKKHCLFLVFVIILKNYNNEHQFVFSKRIRLLAQFLSLHRNFELVM